MYTINKVLADIAKKRGIPENLDDSRLDELKKQKEYELQANIKKAIEDKGKGKLKLMYSKIPDKFIGKKFSDLENTENNKSAIRSAYRFAQEVEIIDRGLFLYGSVGVGKTYILAITAQLVAEYKDKNIYFASEEDILAELKNAYNSNSEVQDTDIIRLIAKNDVIFIDEVGQNDSLWALRNIKRILDECLNKNRLICMTSNYSPKELITRWGGSDTNKVPEQVVDRILEACIIEKVGGASYRGRN